jgi:superfamily II DNA or RNA helicase
MDPLVTSKGYSILKSGLTAAQTQELQDELTVTPKMNTKFATKDMIDAATFKVFRQSPTRWYLPRAWGLTRFGEARSVVPEGEPMNVEFTGKPYDYQVAIIDSFIKAGNGLICVPCGRGKTFMALSIAAKLGKRFIVVVDKEFLMNQWKGEMEALLPGIRIGIIQEDLKQIHEVEEPPVKTATVPEMKAELKRLGLKVGGTREELLARLKEAVPGYGEQPVKARVKYDCCIALIQTLVKREFGPTDFDGFGFTIFDECHHLGAQHFSKALQRVQTAKMLGLSATPIREDGMTKVFQWFLGEPVYWEKTRDPDPTVEVKAVTIKTDDTTYHDVPVDWRGETVTARLLGNVLGCEERNREVVRWIRMLLVEPDRRILVLSERIGHLNRIEEMLSEVDAPTMSYYIGGMKEEVRESGAASARVLLASYAMASEAMNIKSLNAVILASPRKNVEQSTGRILRVQVNKRVIQPVIVDIIDDHSMYKGQWLKRATYYRKCAYQIEDWAMGATSGTKRRQAPVAVKTDGCMIDD